MKFLEENLLDHLQRPEFEELHSVLFRRKFLKGTYICQPGSEANQIFIVESGKVRVYLGYEEKREETGWRPSGTASNSRRPAANSASLD